MPSKFIQFVDLNMRGSCSPYANNVAACCFVEETCYYAHGHEKYKSSLLLLGVSALFAQVLRNWGYPDFNELLWYCMRCRTARLHIQKQQHIRVWEVHKFILKL